MKSRRLKKSVAALGLVLALTLGGFALSLAHEQGPVDAAYSFSLALRLDIPKGVSQWVDSEPWVHLDFLAGYVLQKDQKVSVEVHVLDTIPISNQAPSHYQRAYAPKIARHLLDSKLLI